MGDWCDHQPCARIKRRTRVTARPPPSTLHRTRVLGSSTILCFIEIHWGVRGEKLTRGRSENCGDAYKSLIFVSIVRAREWNVPVCPEQFAITILVFVSTYFLQLFYLGIIEEKIALARLVFAQGSSSQLLPIRFRMKSRLPPTNIFSRCLHCCTRTFGCSRVDRSFRFGLHGPVGRNEGALPSSSLCDIDGNTSSVHIARWGPELPSAFAKGAGRFDSADPAVVTRRPAVPSARRIRIIM